MRVKLEVIQALRRGYMTVSTPRIRKNKKDCRICKRNVGCNHSCYTGSSVSCKKFQRKPDFRITSEDKIAHILAKKSKE